MGLAFEAPKSMESSGNFVNKAGKYMFSVAKIDEAPKGVIGGWAIEAIVRAAEKGNEDQVKRSVTLKFWPPKPDSKDGGEFKRKIWCRAALAIGWMTPTQIKQGGAFSVEDTTSAEGHAFFAHIVFQKDSDRFMELDADHIYHVDDPLAKDYPVDEVVLKMIPPEGRYKPEELDFGTKKKEEDGGSKGGATFDATNL